MTSTRSEIISRLGGRGPVKVTRMKPESGAHAQKVAFPSLNWRELAVLAPALSRECSGLFVERVWVPERIRAPEGYWKSEWAIALGAKERSGTLVVSVGSQRPYLYWSRMKAPRAAGNAATRSGFDLQLSKELRGLRVTAIWALKYERIIVIEFSESIALVFVMIPARPEALLVRAPKEFVGRLKEHLVPGVKVEIIARSRAGGAEKSGKALQYWSVPEARATLPELQIRNDRIDEKRPLETWTRVLEGALEHAAFDARTVAVEKALREMAGDLRGRLRRDERSFEQAQAEPDWRELGHLMMAVLNDPPEMQVIDGVHGRRIPDLVSGELRWVPVDPKLHARAQVEKLYNSAKRKTRRISESTSRIEEWQSRLNQVEEEINTHFAQKPKATLPVTSTHTPSDLNWEGLERLEKIARIVRPLAGEVAVGGHRPNKGAAKGAHSGMTKKARGAVWRGRQFVSQDGSLIWIGRTSEDNLELTFKIARGNDMWLHVKGRPGAHAVIPLTGSKSASLETLLDAAQLVIFYSGGEHWGTTEVDYTFKKHVKRIRDSKEASYTHNKTLMVKPEATRLQRLLKQQDSG